MTLMTLFISIVSPQGIVIILMGAGVLWQVIRRNSRVGRRLLLSGAVLYLVFVLTPVSELAILFLERQYPPMLLPPGSPKLDRIVVLSGYGEEHSSFPVTSNVTEETVYCMSEGIRLYRLLPGGKLIFSGGVLRKGDKSVAGIMADFVHQMGVPREDLILEGNSQNTYENMVEVKKLVGTAPFILVTTAAHMRRAVAVARKLQMEPYAAPARIRTSQNYPMGTGLIDYAATFVIHFSHPSNQRLVALQRAYHEYLGYIWYRLRGRV
jgi:uncharacterized SAM-binding protein YcdF (DUF218 family)